MAQLLAPKAPHKYTAADRLSDALSSLLRRIESGEEFPDACWRVSSRQNVRYEDLSAAYDAHCATK